MAMAIDITPDDEISFTLPATLKQAPRGIVSRVTLFNPNESLMMYKIKATSTTRLGVFRASPVPHGTANIVLHRQPGDACVSLLRCKWVS
eukprot:m.227588 g.227588  ORF g.227588 m.227588 type:complete len:90 (+) comp18817_c3_seq2:233-502(+)